MNHAILTGDIVQSSKLSEIERREIIENIKNLAKIDKKIELKVEIYRGDGFQAEVKDIKNALFYAILLRAFLKGKFHFKVKQNEYDARIAIGIGRKERSLYDILFLSEQTGEAFVNSGRLLDEMKKKSNFIALKSNNDKFNIDFEVNLCLLEVIIANWKPLQADVIFYKILGYTEIAIAEKLAITQPAVNQTSKGAGWWVIEKLLNYFETHITQKLK